MYNIYITQTNFQPKKFGISVKSFSNSLCRQAMGTDGFASLYYTKDYPKGLNGVVVIVHALAELWVRVFQPRRAAFGDGFGRE